MHQMLSPKLQSVETQIIAKGVEVCPIRFGTSKPFELTYFHVLPGCETPIDQHEDRESWIVLQGHGQLNYDGLSYPLTEQDIFYFEAFKMHQVINTSDKILIICSIFW
jgi:mannose-6-phosphate isomerase-like protein (cupin superfamily)